MTLYFPAYTDPMLKDDFVRTAYVFDLYDGDTIYYHVDLGYDVWGTFQTGRLLDINSPEIRPLKTRAEGLESKNALWRFIQQHALNRHATVRPFGFQMRLKSVPATNKHLPDERVMKKGKYGRWLVGLFGADDNGRVVDLNELMIREGYAEPADY